MAVNGAKVADQTIIINATAEAVYELISDPAMLRAWLLDEPGNGPLRHNAGLNNDRSAGQLKIVETIPGKRVLFAWSGNVGPLGRIPDGLVDIVLESGADGTLVHLRHSLARNQGDREGGNVSDCLATLGERLKAAFQTPLPSPRVIERAVSGASFLEPQDQEGALAYALRRLESVIPIAGIVGIILVGNLMLVQRGADTLHSAVELAVLAIILLLGNVFLHTIIGLALSKAGSIQKGLLLVLSGMVSLASCYGFFWAETGAAFGGRDRAMNWMIIALSTALFVGLYSGAFNRLVVRRGLWDPLSRRPSTARSISWLLVLGLVGFCCGSLAAGEPSSSTGKKIDELVGKKYSIDEPGAALLVAKGDAVILRQGYGFADLERRTPITADTGFCIASVTKPITATAVLKLVENGKLKLDQTVVDILPDYSGHAGGVTVAHLLSHTSGIPDVARLPAWRADMQSEITVPQILEHFEELPLSFAPGDEWRYSNSGYLLLGAVIERVVEAGYGDFLHDEIFAPAGMGGSYYGPKYPKRPRAQGYQRASEGYVKAEPVSLSRPFAAGGVVSTANDLFAFSRALKRGQLIDRETLKAAIEPYTLNSGEPAVCGYGWMVGSFHGHRVIQHSGGMPGFTAQMWILPDEDIFAVLLSNSPDKTDQKLIGQIVSLVLDDPEESRKSGKVVQLDAKGLKKFAGRYQLSGLANDVITVNFSEGKLTMHVPPNPVCELHPTGPNDFFVTEEDIQLTFVVDSEDKVQSVILHHGGLDLRAARLRD